MGAEAAGGVAELLGQLLGLCMWVKQMVRLLAGVVESAARQRPL